MKRSTLTTTEAAHPRRKIRYLSAAEIAHQSGRPIGTIHRWASEDGWRRSVDGQRPVLYRVEDVLPTLMRLFKPTRQSTQLDS